MNITRIFAETLVSIDVAIAIKQELKFDFFMNDVDQFCWIALEKGDAVPALYIKLIDQALTDLSFQLKGKYLPAYNTAIEVYKTEWRISEAIELYCSPEYLGILSEKEYLIANEE